MIITLGQLWLIILEVASAQTGFLSDNVLMVSWFAAFAVSEDGSLTLVRS